jgi:hypothetical protein
MDLLSINSLSMNLNVSLVSPLFVCADWSSSSIFTFQSMMAIDKGMVVVVVVVVAVVVVEVGVEVGEVVDKGVDKEVYSRLVFPQMGVEE